VCSQLALTLEEPHSRLCAMKTPPDHANRLYLLLGIALALILYGSTFPWDFVRLPGHFNPLPRLFSIWPAGWNRFMARDVGINVVLYLPLGTLLYLLLARSLHWLPAIVVAILCSGILSTGIEVVQMFEPARNSSALDVACNTMGAALGALVAHRWRLWLNRWTSTEIPRLPGEARPAVFLLLVWIAYQTIPFFPALSTYRLRAILAGLLKTAGFSFPEFLSLCAAWATALLLLDRATGPPAAAIVAGFLFLAPLKALIASRTVTWEELAAVPVAWLAWSQGLRSYPRWAAAGAVLVLSAILALGLEPLPGQAAVSFSWTPFAGSLSYDHAFAALPLLRKGFLYGSALWLLIRSGWSRVASAAALAALLAGIELAQLYLPGHTPEITDPLLALLLGVVLWAIEQPGPRGNPL
jgi:VanZ family protein